MLIGIVAATLGALGYGTATVLQARAVAPSDRSVVVRRWLFASGLVADGSAWLLSLVAFRFLPLAAAQAVLASSVAVTAVLAHLIIRTRIASRTLVAGALFVVGAAMIASSAAPITRHTLSPQLLILGSAALMGMSVVAASAYRRGSATWLSVVAGVAFAGTAVCGRLLELPHLTAATILDSGLLLGFSLVGIVAFARALTLGSEAGASAVMWMTELILAFVTGAALLGDTVRSGFAAVAIAGAACGVFACRMLISDRPHEGRGASQAVAACGSMPDESGQPAGSSSVRPAVRA
jgi:drug/metabolite transporter (DMT)-like permease